MSAKPTSSPPATKGGRWTLLIVIILVVGIPSIAIYSKARQSGLSVPQLFRQILGSDDAGIIGKAGDETIVEASDILEPRPIGFPVSGEPRIGALSPVDLDRDGLMDILVSDMLAHRLGWIRQIAPGEYEEQWIGPEIKAPARTDAADVDGDGDLDILVAAMGQLMPTNAKIGSVIILENDGTQQFAPHVLIEEVARVTDVRGGDLDGDGDIDLAVGQFGYNDGETRWMENLGGWQFESHILQRLSGVIHTIPHDVDGDGDLDIVSVVGQEWEEIHVFENDGKGHFEDHLIWGSTNDDYGSSGIRLTDMDRDGDIDILYTNGDTFDYNPPRPRPWHSVQWLENEGEFRFKHHPIGKFLGASAACGADVDGDGDVDVVAASGWNVLDSDEPQSVILFKNDGKMNFQRFNIATEPTHLATLEAVDLDDDGFTDFVSGGMHSFSPHRRLSRITLWHNRGTLQDRH